MSNAKRTSDDGPSAKVRRTDATPDEPSNSSASNSGKNSTASVTKSNTGEITAASNSATTSKLTKQESLAENLTCTICQSLFHDCVSAQPCLHSFCAGCLSDWLAQSNACPVCRKTVECVSMNHTLGNCVASLCSQRPEMARTASDIRELDEKNKIPKSGTLKLDYTNLRSVFRNATVDSDDDDDDDNDDEEDGDDDDDSSDEDVGAGVFPLANNTQLEEGFTMRCRQCPAANGADQTATRNLEGPPPLGSTCKVYVTCFRNGNLAAASNNASDYVCSDSQIHILCECCRKPMPNRARRGIPTWLVPSQRCAVCERVYCHAYWGCQRTGAPCYGCLAPLRDWRMTDSFLLSYLLGNEHETNLLNTYLLRNSMSVADMFRKCYQHLHSGNWTVTPTIFSQVPDSVGTREVKSDTPLCRDCAQLVISDLAMQFRSNIPVQDKNSHFNEARRPQCWYGTECRTQTHNQAHASAYNHMCRRTKF